jgi:hypothetical protein
MKKIFAALAIAICLYGCSKKSDVVTPIKTIGPDTLVKYKFGGFMMPGYLVATDENGKVITSVKIQTGISTYFLTTPQTYPKDRINVYEIDIPTDPNQMITILGYLQIKKGSSNDESVYPRASAHYPLNVHLSNVSSFNQLTICTDAGGQTISSLSDTVYAFKYMYYSDDSKVYAYITKNGMPSYHFFDIPKGSDDLTIDLNQCTSTMNTINLTINGLYPSVQVAAKTDKNSGFEYDLGTSSILGAGTVVFNYPKEPFQQYSTIVMYGKLSGIQNIQYGKATVGPAISTDVSIFPATINFTGTSMADFSVSTTGTYDYYYAHFIAKNISTNLDINYWSPSAADYKNVKLPDLSQFIPSNLLDPTLMRLQDYGLYRVDGFDEKKFTYKRAESDHDVNIQQVVLHNY